MSATLVPAHVALPFGAIGDTRIAHVVTPEHLRVNGGLNWAERFDDMDHTDGASLRSAATWPYDDLTDDELADLAERALEQESMRLAELNDQQQALALQHLRGVVSDLINDSPAPHREHVS